MLAVARLYMFLLYVSLLAMLVVVYAQDYGYSITGNYDCTISLCSGNSCQNVGCFQQQTTTTATIQPILQPPDVSVNVTPIVTIPRLEPRVNLTAPSFDSPTGVFVLFIWLSIWVALASQLGVGIGSIVTGFIVLIYAVMVGSGIMMIFGLLGITTGALYYYFTGGA